MPEQKKEQPEFMKDWSVDYKELCATYKTGLQINLDSRMGDKCYFSYDNYIIWYRNERKAGLTDKEVKEKFEVLNLQFREICEDMVFPKPLTVEESRARIDKINKELQAFSEQTRRERAEKKKSLEAAPADAPHWNRVSNKVNKRKNLQPTVNQGQER